MIDLSTPAGRNAAYLDLLLALERAREAARCEALLRPGVVRQWNRLSDRLAALRGGGNGHFDRRWQEFLGVAAATRQALRESTTARAARDRFVLLFLDSLAGVTLSAGREEEDLLALLAPAPDADPDALLARLTMARGLDLDGGRARMPLLAFWLPRVVAGTADAEEMRRGGRLPFAF